MGLSPLGRFEIDLLQLHLCVGHLVGVGIGLDEILEGLAGFFPIREIRAVNFPHRK